MKTLLALVLSLVVAPMMAAQTTTSPKPPIIDMHMHAYVKVTRTPDGKPMPRLCVLEPCEPRRGSTTDEGILRDTIAAMEKFNIVKGFLSHESANVQKWVSAAPDRFISSIWFGFPNTPLPDISQLRDQYRAGRLKGMGEILTQYAAIAPNDPRLEPYFALAEEMNVPVLIHTCGTGNPSIRTFRSSLGHPLLLEEVLVRHPKLRIYLENAGYPFLDEMIALMTQYPQVHADLSTVTWIFPRTAFHRYLRALVEAGLGKRLMFGSDAMEWPEAIGLAIEAIESANFLTAEQKRDIFYNNAARFLRLPDSE